MTKEPKLHTYELASFDIKNLFPSIPLSETIEIILKKLFPHKNSKFQNFSRRQFRTALLHATTNVTFKFNGQYYEQFEGVSMGSPLAPILADIFLNHFESEFIANYHADHKPVYFKRYVDDTFLAFSSVDHITLFLDYLNSCHSNIQFTCEFSIDNVLPFLDILIVKTDNCIETNVYQKPTHTNLYTRWTSLTPKLYKIRLIHTLLERSYSICSTYKLLHVNIQRVRNAMIENFYPAHLVDLQIKKFLDKKCISDKSKLKPFGPEKHKIFIKLPFIGNFSEQLKNELRSLSKYTPAAQIILVNQPTSISNYFKFKDSEDFSLKSNVVYSITCKNCSKSYIGKTERHLKDRIQEHTSGKHQSAFFNHCNVYGCDPMNHDVKTLSHSAYSKKLLIKESLLINKFNPVLNKDMYSTPLYLFNV